jgi:hypothetical protein
MSNIWFVFRNNGQLLFKTTDEKNIINIPSNIVTPVIVKNPSGYNPDINQITTYDTTNNKVIFTEAKNLDDIGSFELSSKSIQIVNYKELKTHVTNLESNVNLNKINIEENKQISIGNFNLIVDITNKINS